MTKPILISCMLTCCISVTQAQPWSTSVTSNDNINVVGGIIERNGGLPSGGVNRGVGLAFKDGDNPTFVSGIVGIRTTPGGHYDGDLAFFTNKGNFNATAFSQMIERMRITASGGIGIGTSAPTDKLTVFDGNAGLTNIGTGANLNFRRNSNTNIGQSIFWHNDTSSPIAAISVAAGNQRMSGGNWIPDDDGINVVTYGPSNISFMTNSAGRMTITAAGNVGIGTPSPDSKLTVAGKIHSQEVKVTATAGAVFVFEDDYKLRSLTETEAFIKQNRHLPEIAPAREMVKNGIDLGEMNIKLLQKIEELTLHLIAQDKKLEEQSALIESILTQRPRK